MADNNEPDQASKDIRNKWLEIIKRMELFLKQYFKKLQAKFENSEVDLEQYMKNNLESTFKHCKNDIHPIKMNSEFVLSEEFFGKTFIFDKFIDEIKKDTEYKTENEDSLTRLSRLIICKEITNSLLANRAIPGVKINNTISLSYNAMLDWLYYSLEVFIRRDKFLMSKEIELFSKVIIDTRSRLNILLDVINDYSVSREEINKRNIEIIDMIHDTFSMVVDMLETIKIADANTPAIQERRYRKVIFLLYGVQNIFFTMTNYISLRLMGPEKEWYKSEHFPNIIVSYENVITYLFIAAMPSNKFSKIADKITKSWELSAPDDNDEFTIFEPGVIDRASFKIPHLSNISNRFNLSRQSIEDSPTKKWSTGTVITIALAIILAVIGGGIGIYYLNIRN